MPFCTQESFSTSLSPGVPTAAINCNFSMHLVTFAGTLKALDVADNVIALILKGKHLPIMIMEEV